MNLSGDVNIAAVPELSTSTAAMQSTIAAQLVRFTTLQANPAAQIKDHNTLQAALAGLVSNLTVNVPGDSNSDGSDDDSGENLSCVGYGVASVAGNTMVIQQSGYIPCADKYHVSTKKQKGTTIGAFALNLSFACPTQFKSSVSAGSIVNISDLANVCPYPSSFFLYMYTSVMKQQQFTGQFAAQGFGPCTMSISGNTGVFAQDCVYLSVSGADPNSATSKVTFKNGLQGPANSDPNQLVWYSKGQAEVEVGGWSGTATYSSPSVPPTMNMQRQGYPSFSGPFPMQ